MSTTTVQEKLTFLFLPTSPATCAPGLFNIVSSNRGAFFNRIGDKTRNFAAFHSREGAVLDDGHTLSLV
jgi:hypothetical protein